MAEQFHFEPTGVFDLQASRQFIEGFRPAGQPTSDTDALVLALLTDDWRGALVRVWQTPQRVLGEIIAGDADRDVVRAQVERMLSLDVDGTDYADVCARDDVLRGVAALFGGLRPVQFGTPFDAACWSVLSQRTRVSQAAAVRTRLVETHGRQMTVGDDRHRVFPTPTAIAALDAVQGVSAAKLDRLRAVADAASEGALDPVVLRELPVGDALDHLQQITGIGPFGAELILVRGAGAPDVFPSRERRLHQAMAALYELDDPTVEELAEVADGWRPYRSWAAVLLRAWWAQHHQ